MSTTMASPQDKDIPKRHNVPAEKRKEARIPILLAPPVAKRYRDLAKRQRIPVSEPARRGLALWESMDGRLPHMVQVLGYIPGGEGCVVRPLEDCFVNVGDEFAGELKGGEYFLIVDGDSMCSEKSDSIESGEYALFRPDRDPCGKVAHIEWENDSGERELTLKRFTCGENDTVTLKPANPKYKPIVKRRAEVQVRGVFVRKWSPKSS